VSGSIVQTPGSSSPAARAEVAPSAEPALSLTGPKRPVTGRPRDPHRKRTVSERIEAYISKLSTKNNFWHRVCSLIWLPFAFRSGIKMKRLDQKTFTAVLPFRRFNRNWYNAMAGAALLGNSEIAGGMYVFGVCGGDYTVVCKHLEYKFLRPCFGPAVYKITPRENIEELLAHKGEFNITIDLEISQAINKPSEREKRVGRCSATFHVTPKLHQKSRKERGQRANEPEALTSESSAGGSLDEPPPT
jgi:hypothetical protein